MASETGSAERERLANLLRPALGFVANVSVVTALLVYFGWRRSQVQAARLGIDESILGMSTRDYVMRSVRPVLVLLIGVGVVGVAWAMLDGWLDGWLRARRSGPAAAPARWLLRLLAFAWLVLPLLVWLLGFVARELAYVLFPVSIALGILLLLYAGYLSRPDGEPDPATERRALVARACGALLVAVCLFWTASNYAEVQGVHLARDLVARMNRRPGVTVYSQSRLYLDGPGVSERTMPGDEGALRYRYSGLRLLEHTGGKYFLVSDEWSTTYGVVFILREDDKTVRLDFVRDQR